MTTADGIAGVTILQLSSRGDSIGTFWGPFCVPSAWRSGVWPLGFYLLSTEIKICPNMFSSNTTAFILYAYSNFYITINSFF